ncbi:hypothetical protein [Streptomyces acidiscabies]|uniref:Uncharacterized protein n=1 Tax=Streptomyces acidiscabies TaxID=42234 RepID=A0A0L0JD05_9ACTN|nr:hypothetical protein [Streptomyces acidiscabies]KND23354.1 hypothetical protein IQ63_44930 [Streptomyces acidiscabies]
MRKPLIAGAQVVSGLTIVLLSLFGMITKEPYSILAPMLGTGLFVDGCRDLWTLRTRQRSEQQR